jgi:hypothetical protein
MSQKISIIFIIDREQLRQHVKEIFKILWVTVSRSHYTLVLNNFCFSVISHVRKFSFNSKMTFEGRN